MGVITAFSSAVTSEMIAVDKRLLGVYSFVNNRECLFMIDSGATNNFLSKIACEKLGLLSLIKHEKSLV
jgi:predicted aspartyl protease